MRTSRGAQTSSPAKRGLASPQRRPLSRDEETPKRVCSFGNWNLRGARSSGPWNCTLSCTGLWRPNSLFTSGGGRGRPRRCSRSAADRPPGPSLHIQAVALSSPGPWHLGTPGDPDLQLTTQLVTLPTSWEGGCTYSIYGRGIPRLRKAR